MRCRARSQRPFYLTFDPFGAFRYSALSMEIDAIRESIRKGTFYVTDHVITEGFKDGISVADKVTPVVKSGRHEVQPHTADC
jgi:hypothetical protein